MSLAKRVPLNHHSFAIETHFCKYTLAIAVIVNCKSHHKAAFNNRVAEGLLVKFPAKIHPPTKEIRIKISKIHLSAIDW